MLNFKKRCYTCTNFSWSGLFKNIYFHSHYFYWLCYIIRNSHSFNFFQKILNSRLVRCVYARFNYRVFQFNLVMIQNTYIYLLCAGSYCLLNKNMYHICITVKLMNKWCKSKRTFVILILINTIYFEYLQWSFLYLNYNKFWGKRKKIFYI